MPVGAPTLPLGVAEAVPEGPPLRDPVADALAQDEALSVPPPPREAVPHGVLLPPLGVAEGAALRESLAPAEAVACERLAGAEAHAVIDTLRQAEKVAVPVSETVPLRAAEPLPEALPPLGDAEGTPGVPLCVGDALAGAEGVAPAELLRPLEAVAGAEGDAPLLPLAPGLSVAPADVEALPEGAADADAQRLALTEAVLEGVAMPVRLSEAVGAGEALSREGEGVGVAPPAGDAEARAVADAVKVALAEGAPDVLPVALAVHDVLSVKSELRDTDAEPVRERSVEGVALPVAEGAGEPVKELEGEVVAVPDGQCDSDAVPLPERVGG